MSRYRGPVEKLERRFGVSLALKGERRLAGKSALDKRPYAPGQHGARRGKISEYGLQLREKQKAKFMYGLSEKQFRRLFAEAARREGNTGVLLIQLLEQRLDNVVYRMGFATTRRFARQLVTHGHILVNGKRVEVIFLILKPLLFRVKLDYEAFFNRDNHFLSLWCSCENAKSLVLFDIYPRHNARLRRQIHGA